MAKAKKAEAAGAEGRLFITHWVLVDFVCNE